MIDNNNREILNLNNKYEFIEFKYLSILALGQEKGGKSKLINEIKRLKKKRAMIIKSNLILI